MLRVSSLVVIGLAGLTSPLLGQQLRGVVRDSGLAAPLPGAVLTLVDSAGVSLGRVISDGAGRFAIPLQPRAARLRAVRIGYRPRDLALTFAGDTLEIAMAKLPPMLATMRVTDSELCPGANASSAAVDLWEQAKAGLLATVVARETSPARMQSLTYSRATTPTDERVTQQRTQITSGFSNRPFVAAAQASYFARLGFMQEDASGRLYNAPDADVLLDDDFAATHCFRVQSADKEHPEQIGLAFSPARGRDRLVDVTGVIWIDRVTPKLRTLEFRYTGLEPAATESGSGGHIEFRTMQNGVAFIERWHLRLASLVADPRRRSLPSGVPNDRTKRTDFRLVDLRESGGIVLDATWPDGVAWHDSVAGLAGSVVQRHSSLAIPAATITLVGTNTETVASPDGSFGLLPLVPGRYTVVVTDTTLGRYARARSTELTADVTRGRFTTIRVELPPLIDVIRDICRDQPVPRGSSLIVGRVRPLGVDRPTGNIVARWQANYNNGSPVRSENGVGQPVTVDGSEQRIKPDDQGNFVVCGVARGRPIRLRYSEGERFADTTVVVSDTLLHPMQWRPALPPPRPNPLEISSIEPDDPIGEIGDVWNGATKRLELRWAERRRKPAAR